MSNHNFINENLLKSSLINLTRVYSRVVRSISLEETRVEQGAKEKDEEENAKWLQYSDVLKTWTASCY